MPNYTSGSTRVAIAQADLAAVQADGSVVLDSRRVRPFWFDGRFLNARDLEREQNYFLERQADLGQASGFQTLTGLEVDQTNADGAFVGPGAFVLHAGEGVTPAGEAVSIAEDLTISLDRLVEQPNLDVQFGVSVAPRATAQNRTGLYVIGVQPMEYTANSITAYPTTIQGPRTTHDADIVEATVVTLTPYPNPAANFPASQQQAALARQIFVTGSPAVLPDLLLPLALVSVQQGVISWIDPWLVRRDRGQQYSGVRFGLSAPQAQEAYLMQYDLQLQSIVDTRRASGLKGNFAASDFLQAIPSGGRLPMDSIDTSNFSQVFFPQEMDVRLSIVPMDELPALLEDSLSLPPIDLTLPRSAYASMAVLVLIPVARDQFAALQAALPETPLNPTLPQVLANRSPLQLLRLFQGAVNLQPASAIANNAWATAIGSQQYGFYLRRSSQPTLRRFTAPTGVSLSSSSNPAAYGQAVTFTAALSPLSATGSVAFLDGTTTLGISTIAAGMASLDVPGLAVGSHPITATYAGDDADAAGKSGVLTQVVNKAVGTITVSSSINPSTLGNPVNFTAAVTPASATGTVQFLDGTIMLGTGTIEVGAVTFSIETLALGTHPITAVYSGDGNDAAAVSTILNQTVNKVPSTVLLSSSDDPATVGEPVTFTATITPETATGTIQFLDGATALGTGAISGNTASLTVSTLTAGVHSITGIYSGDGNDASGTSAVLLQTVNAAPSSVALTSSLNPSTLGQAVIFTAAVTPAAATGSVQLLDGAAALGTATLGAGAAAIPVMTLAVGTHPITAAYSGDTNDTPSTSDVLTQTVNPAPSAIVLGSSVNPSTVGQEVVFTATVTPASSTGSVQFLDGTAVLGGPPLTSGTASFADTALQVGSHSITAVYGGDRDDAASVSSVLTQVVQQVASSVILSSSANPSTVGQLVTFTANLTPVAATGTVQFLDGGSVLATAALDSGAAVLATPSLAVGAHSITAAYSGDADDAAAVSAPLTQTVNKAESNVVLSSSANPSTVGESVTLTARVTPAAATGAIQFVDGTTALGTATLTAGTAAFPDAALAVGDHTLAAIYAGDEDNLASTSAPLTQTVDKTPTRLELSSSVNPSEPGQSITFTAAIIPPTATGTVQFLDGTTEFGTATAAAGSATFSDATLSNGPHTVTAVYAGDENDEASTSAPLTQNVGKTLTSVALSSSANPATVGQVVTFTANLTPSTATGQVEFLDGATVIGTNALSAGATAIDDATLAVGGHSVTAIYGGDAINAESTSPVLDQEIEKINPRLTLASSANPSFQTQAVVFTVTITPATATGTVTFTNAFNDGTTSLGTVDLNEGQAQLQVLGEFPSGLPVLALGIHNIIATYAGDATIASASVTLIQTVITPEIQ